MVTMGLHNFINISNFADADFVEVMTQTRIINTDSETDSDDTKTSYATNALDGEYMSRIRYNIANMFWKNLNS